MAKVAHFEKMQMQCPTAWQRSPRPAPRSLQRLFLQRRQRRSRDASPVDNLTATGSPLGRSTPRATTSWFDLYLIGEYERDDYPVLRSDIMREPQGLDRKLTGPDYPVESVLTKLDKLSDVLEHGKRGQRKKVLGMLFESVSTDGQAATKEVEPQ